ncbi:MAG: hypothetical protein ACRC5C_03340, partial [Bacilli bacterium]
MDFPLKVIPYSREHKDLFTRYRTSNIQMDSFVLEHALSEMQERTSLTFLVTDESNSVLFGYYTLLSTALLYHHEDKISALPSVEIKLFAVTSTFEGRPFNPRKNLDEKYSDVILGMIIGDIYVLSTESLAIKSIVLRSTPNAVSFYKRNGFIELNDYLSFEHDIFLPNDPFSEQCVPMVYL